MIDQALTIIRDELEAYFRLLGDDTATVILDNISLLDTQDGANLKDKVIISLVNVEEESTLKNLTHKVRLNGGINYVEPPVHLNLYLLFSANYVGESTSPTPKYTLALTRLSTIIQFFQSKRLFTLHNSPNANLSQSIEDLNNPDLSNLRITIELYTLTFEQINHLWGSLGGKQLPFVMYKARLVEIQDPLRRNVPVIEEVRGDHTSTPEE